MNASSNVHKITTKIFSIRNVEDVLLYVNLVKIKLLNVLNV